ncbi:MULTISPECIES: hypothetical protein [unclassified Janthinobacterium]|uniref:hypothetical protein n=1 Tax=unclassified Janthinobacterium TaxID=2610881 RepID=UPI00161E1EC5|nr:MULTISPECIES: hypothetical protein [unclassified Janthinobacterium]MBB5610391.1 hypothetical protein [Janthinobacterium sp. S3T4]MBB5615772.1 hypothetical protein [Janthinobacterium sp. S3M3]
MSAPPKYMIQLTKRSSGRYQLKVVGQGGVIKGDIKALQELTQAISLLLATAKKAENTSPEVD